MSSQTIHPPTPLSRDYVRLVLGFGVGVVVGVAPFLGAINVPFFEPLADVFPNEGRPLLFAFGAFLTGLVAVAMEFYAGERITAVRLRRLFARTLAVILLAFLALSVMVVKFVERMEVADGEIASFAIAGRIYDESCPCARGISDKKCIEILSADPVLIESCWDSDKTDNVHLALLVSYLLLTGGFGALVGLLLLRRNQRRREAARRAAEQRRSKASKKAPAKKQPKPRSRRAAKPKPPQPGRDTET